MSLLDELKIRNQVIDGEIWISLLDAASHVLNAIEEFASESSELSIKNPVSIQEAAYIQGMVAGMASVATLLSQGGIEAEFHEKINTVDDLLKTIEKK
jgi:hypothetical protein